MHRLKVILMYNNAIDGTGSLSEIIIMLSSVDSRMYFLKLSFIFKCYGQLGNKGVPF